MRSWLAANLEPVGLFDEAGQLDQGRLRAELIRRRKLLAAAWADGLCRTYLLKRAAADPVFFFDQFVFGYDPRRLLKLPLVLWPRQRDYIRFLHQACETGQEFICEKSRDVGVTYLTAAYALHRWRFSPGFKTTFCANKLDLVDKRGNPDCLFEKIRLILRSLPAWLLPEGFSWAHHDKEANLVNPANRNVITGEGGDNAGRGGRSTLYVVDEAAHVERADAVNAATSANAFCRVWASSVNGVGNFFYRQRHSGAVPVFTFHWRDDPRKDEAWAKAERARLGPVIFAQEHDLDYGASIEGVCIPKAWVDAARELRRRLAGTVQIQARSRAGLDVGGGKAESVFIARRGPLVTEPEVRQDPDTIDVAWWAIELCLRAEVRDLAYDAIGVGHGLASAFRRAETLELGVHAVNVGDPPTDTIWPDERTSKQKFANFKAELWWKAREAFNRSYLHWRHLQGEPDGIAYPLDEVILMAEDEELARQLATPKWLRSETGKIIIEGKDKLARRGVKSPDRAEAFVLTFFDPPEPGFFYAGLA